MDNRADLLRQLSQALAARTAEARASVVGIRGENRGLSGVLWQGGVAVTSAQSLPKCERYELAAATGDRLAATLAGIDAATNIAVLRTAKELPAKPLEGRIPSPGELVLALGADQLGRPSARLGSVNAVGDAWHSSAGGRIDSRIALDIRLDRSEEGGPVFDAGGGFIGMSVFAPRRRVIAIPHATLERVVPVLLKDGRVARGWLGIGLQPVAVPDALRETTGQSAAMMAMSIAAGGPAAKAGLAAGDILLSLDGREVGRLRNLMATLGPDSIGRRVETRIIRSGAIQTVPLTIEARPNE